MLRTKTEGWYPGPGDPPDIKERDKLTTNPHDDTNPGSEECLKGMIMAYHDSLNPVSENKKREDLIALRIKVEGFTTK